MATCARVEELKAHGIAEIPFDTTALASLAAVFDRLPIQELFSKTTGHICEVPAVEGESATFVVAHTAVTDRMRWLWACDEVTLRFFDVAANGPLDALCHVVGGPVSLYAACFVVVLGGELTAAEVKEHKDWAHPRLQAGDAFTCLTPLVALPSTVGGLHAWPWQRPEYVYMYKFGRYAAIDGKLLHRTEPFSYRRCSDKAACDSYEATGHLRVLVSLSIASDAPRLAPYVHKVLRAMAPSAALVRGHTDVFLDSQSEQWTSDDDTANSADGSDCEGDDLQAIGTMLQDGLWSCELSSSNCQANSFQLELAFDFEDDAIYSSGSCVGNVEYSLNAWHASLAVEREGVRFELSGEFVRTPTSVMLQGRYRSSDGGGSFALSPPAPWRIEIRQWERLPLPRRALALPPDPGSVEVTWSAGPGVVAGVATGRAARWLTSAVASLRGQAVAVSGACTEQDLAALAAGCIVVAPDTAQRRGIFARLLTAANAASVAAVVFVNFMPRRLPRAARPPHSDGETFRLVPCFTIAYTTLRSAGVAELDALQGLEMCVQSAAV